VKGFGRLKDHTEISRGAEYAVDFMPKIKLETAIADDLPAQVIEAMTPRNEAIFFISPGSFRP
jgi:nitrogen regulatory protein P-II 2